MPKPILLVDDDQNDRALSQIALIRANLLNSVVSVRGGEEALDYLFRRKDHADRAAGNPAVVLLDLKMPKVDGLQVLEEIRAHAETISIPVVMFTNSNEEEKLLKSYALGVNAFIKKPTEFADFQYTVQLVCSFWARINERPAGSVQ
jgi:CheY-like chemotaxis protein